MTTTLRPAGPERAGADGSRTRGYTVCVNSRPVGAVEIGTDPRFGDRVGRISALGVDAADRRRGRGTVAVLAAEEVLRHRGCARVEVTVPAGAVPALRIAGALGYTERSRTMAKTLAPGDGPLPLPAGSVLRPLTEAEYAPWREREREGFAAALGGGGVPPGQARAYAATAMETALPAGRATPDTALLVLDHDGAGVGHLWVRTAEPAWVFSVEVAAAHRGHGHGRTLMLAAEDAARAAGARTLTLNVFAGNTPALALYASLGYRATEIHCAKFL